MDDPWGSPWDDNPPRLDLPAPPPLVHTPRVTNKATSPWGGTSVQDEDENPWGNINGGAFGGGGSESPGWAMNPRKSPSLRPARSGTVSRQPSWGSLGQRSEDLEVARPIASLGSLNGDSARSLHDVTATNGYLTPASDSKTNNGEERRLNENDTTQDDVLRKNDNDTDSETKPNGECRTPPGSPKPAAQAGTRPGPARQVSKVQELVDMYDGIEKKRDEPNEGPLAGPRIKLVGSPVDDAAEGTDKVETARPAQESGLDGDESAVRTSNEEPEDVMILTADNDGGPAVHAKDDDSTRQGSLAEQNRPAAGEVNTEETRMHSDVQTAVREDDHDTPVTPTGVTQETPEDNPFASITLPSTPFTVDMSQLDSLFPSTAASTVEPEPVPDVIIDDTFASISERKTWYRVSRPGPMRQHNLGNDEDYVRLDWRSSEIKTGCLRIVRRWMEEDSIAGRVGVGRRMKGMGIGGAGMFGWNSKEPEIGIGELLSKNRGHMRESGMVSQESRITEPSAVSPTMSTFSPTSPERISFGWEGAPSSRFAPDVFAASKAGNDVSKRSSWVVPKSIGASEPSKRNSWIAPPPVVPSSKEMAFGKTAMTIDSVVANEWASPAGEEVKATAVNGDGMDDDDDWGEMVTSPPLPAEPTVIATSLGDTMVSQPTTGLDKTASSSSFPTTAIEDDFTEFESAWGPAQLPATLTTSESAQGLLGVEDQPHTTEPSTETLGGPTVKSSMLGQPTHQSFGVTSVLADLNTAEPEEEKRKHLEAQMAMADKDNNNVEALFNESLTTSMAPHKPVLATTVELPVSTPISPDASAPNTRKPLSKEEETTAQSILRNLPDLTYMLR